MPLHPQAKAFLDQLNRSQAQGAPPAARTPASMRAGLTRAAPPAGPEVGKVEERKIPGPAGEIGLRIYTPQGAGPFPGLLYFHPGGWVMGNLNVFDGGARHITNIARSVVIAVDYRLAPEHKFPAGLEDCYAAAKWVASEGRSINVDPQRVSVMGDSTGGNMAAVVAMMARDRGGPALAHQVLAYPVVGHDFTTASWKKYGVGHMLAREMQEWFLEQYVKDKDEAHHPYVFPMFAKDLSRLPPALVIAAECDALRDEAAAYAERLKQAGVPTKYSEYPGMCHGFFRVWWVMDAAKDAYAEVGAVVGRKGKP